MENVYKIIKIIDDETIVINAGFDDDIDRGDSFEIFEEGETIFDPETKENLGTLDTVKDTVKAINVFPKMSICRHIITTNSYVNLSLNITRISNKTLNVDSTQISGGLLEDKTIRIGDKVRKI